jgi:hypothetical protein
MNKHLRSLAIGATAIASLGGLATAAHAGERDVHAQLSIQLPFLVATNFEHNNHPRPVYGHVAPVYPAAHGGYQRHDGYRHDHRNEYRRGHRDRDHDGVRNRYDRDRDGDGVPNRYDRRPNNPYRY